jgi:hypothetical protein
MYSDFFQSPPWNFARNVIVPVTTLDLPAPYAPEAREDPSMTETRKTTRAARGTRRV